MAKDMYDALSALQKAVKNCESFAGYVSELEEAESYVCSADHNAQSASSEANSLSGDLPNNLTEGLCHAIDSIESECDECQSNVDSAQSSITSAKDGVEGLLEDTGAAIKAVRDSLVKNRDLEDCVEVEILDELFKLVTGSPVNA
jgi:hypothetical protein